MIRVQYSSSEREERQGEYRKVIPCLDIRNGCLAKGAVFVDLRDTGDPAQVPAAYSQEGGDELVFLDIRATIEKRRTLVSISGEENTCGHQVRISEGGRDYFTWVHNNLAQ